MKGHAVIVCNNKSEIEYFSNGVEKLSGWKKKDVIGKNIKSIFSFVEQLEGFDDEGIDLISLLSKENELFFEDILMVCADGSLLEVGATIIPKKINTREIDCFLLTLTDFKAQHQWEKLRKDFVQGKSREIKDNLKTIEGFVEIHSNDIEEMIEEDRKRSLELEKALEELEKRRLIQEKLLQKVLNAQEDERKYIVHAIHDDLLQPIIATQYGLQLIEESAGENEEVSKRIKGLLKLLDETITITRRLLFDLRPVLLDEIGLKAAIKRLIELFGEDTGMNVNLSIEELPKLSISKENIVYRIVQEALTNIKKHANADIVNITSKVNDRILTLKIIDNGNGFIAEKVWEELSTIQSFGLEGMKERAEMCGGTINIRSKVQEGTEVNLTVPLD